MVGRRRGSFGRRAGRGGFPAWGAAPLFRRPARRRRLGDGRRTLLCAAAGVGRLQGHSSVSRPAMLRSMTGFGASDLATATGRYAVEARSLNHRFLEVVVRLPRELAPLEERIRTLVQGRVLRG